MAMIHINRSGTNVGVFAEEDVREGLRTGRFIGTDLGWREGMPNWKPLSDFPEFGAPPVGEVPPPIAPPVTPAVSPTIQEATTTAPRPGLPWENRQARGFLNAFVET